MPFRTHDDEDDDDFLRGERVVGILIAALVMLIFTVVLLVMGDSATQNVTFRFLQWKFYAQTWFFFAVTVIATALVSWILHLLGQQPLKQRLQERQNELNEIKDRLRRAENNLEQHESKIHEFTLQVLQLARVPLPDHTSSSPQVVFEETPERNALNPAPSASPAKDSEDAPAAQDTETI